MLVLVASAAEQGCLEQDFWGGEKTKSRWQREANPRPGRGFVGEGRGGSSGTQFTLHEKLKPVPPLQTIDPS